MFTEFRHAAVLGNVVEVAGGQRYMVTMVTHDRVYGSRIGNHQSWSAHDPTDDLYDSEFFPIAVYEPNDTTGNRTIDHLLINPGPVCWQTVEPIHHEVTEDGLTLRQGETEIRLTVAELRRIASDVIERHNVA